MTRFMYDSINVARLPATAKMFAGYVNGRWPTFNQLRAAYPSAICVSIAVTIDADADVLDVEKGDAYPTQAPSWAVRQRNRGATPTIYCSLNTWPAVKQAFKDAGVAEPLYWIAHYDGMSAIPDGAIAKQYTGGDGYDLSSVADYWPGIDPEPVLEDEEMLMVRTPDGEIDLALGGVLVHLEPGEDAALAQAGVREVPIPQRVGDAARAKVGC